MDWSDPHARFEILEVLGKGTFGTVYKVDVIMFL